MIGLDCGNSSFRTILGAYDGKKITTQVIDQTKNEMLEIGEYFYWDIYKIYSGFIDSLKKVVQSGVQIDSIGVCTWGIDFALFDENGLMISNPLSYRNEQGKQYLDKLTEEESLDVFEKTGIIPDKINSVFLIQAIRDRMSKMYSITDKILMIPDVLNYFLTGVMENEPSELSTSQLFSAKTMSVSEEVCNKLGVKASHFCKIGKHGTVIGYLNESVKKELGIDYEIPIVCVPSHDTASAVCAIPAREDKFLFISSGTWALIGTELDKPIIKDCILKNNLTNEVGAFEKITLLKNSMGMFVIQRIKKEYDWAMGEEHTWRHLDDLANACVREAPLFDVNDDRFFNPTNMSDEIWTFLEESGQVSGEKKWDQLIKSTYYSMACNNAKTISDIEKVTGEKYEYIHIVGGGSKNIMLNRLTSMCTGKTVLACGEESTALGNIATQLTYHNESMTLKEIRSVIDESIDVKEYVSYYDDSILKRYNQL